MFKEIKLLSSGGSYSVNLPKAMLARHRLDTGDAVYAIDTEDGILITPRDSNFAKAMEIAERGSKKYGNALREL